MRRFSKGALIAIFAGLATARASNLDTIGVTLLRETTTNLNGAGIYVAQPEANYNLGTNWEVNPGAVGQPVSLFTYTSANGSSTAYPNSISSESGHADGVAANFYGLPGGVATNVAHVDNYDADYFVTFVVQASAAINGRVVNQSFIDATNNQLTDDPAYDNYAAKYGTLFVSAVGNGGPVYPPATCYNGIGVGAYGGSSSIGPTLDNGRCKPDITAPSDVTSFSTPQVAGAAAILMQAALRGDGGSNTDAAADSRTVKALLLNGAVKPADWTNSASSPLDARYGAGVVNVFNSYEQLAGDEHGYIDSSSVSAGNPHPPTGAGGTINALSGWDFSTNTSSSFPVSQDGVKHYYFNVTNSAGGDFTATATLVWNRHQNQTGINDLDLFLYNAANSNLVAASTSAVDNVEHIFVPQLPQGRYDLQVWMSASGISPVNNSEPYALAWEFFSQSLSAVGSGTNLVLSWPVYPDGFVAESTTDLWPPQVWATNEIPAATVTNSQNVILLDATNPVEFFRLRRP